MTGSSTYAPNPVRASRAEDEPVRLIAWGELLWDLYPDRAHLGGAPANVAFHAAQWGAKSALWSRVGDDEWGRRALEQLARSAMELDALRVDPEKPTGSVRVELGPEGPSFTIEREVAWDAILPPARAREQLARADVFYFGSLAQRTLANQRALFSLLDATSSPGSAEGRRPLHFLDLNLRPPFITAELARDLIERAHLVKLNEDELAWIEQTYPCDDGVAWLFSFPELEWIALTEGARGARLLSRTARFERAAFPSRGTDPVGAGDAFAAVLAVEWARGVSPAQALESACRYAAWVAEQPGAMPRLPTTPAPLTDGRGS